MNLGKMKGIKIIVTIIILFFLIYPLYHSFQIAFFTSENQNIQLMAMSVFVLAIIGGINMFFSLFFDREEIQSETTKNFHGKPMRKTKRILWNFKKTHGETFTEEYGTLLKMIPKDEYSNANFTNREHYATQVDEARGDYAYFFFDLYNDRWTIGKRFLKKTFNPDDIRLLLDIVAPMEKTLAQVINSDFNKKEAFDYFRELFEKVKK